MQRFQGVLQQAQQSDDGNMMVMMVHHRYERKLIYRLTTNERSHVPKQSLKLLLETFQLKVLFYADDTAILETSLPD